LDRIQAAAAGRLGDLCRLFPGAVVAPQVVIVKRLKLCIHRNDAGARGIDGQRFDSAARNTSLRQRLARGGRQRLHVVGVALGGVIRIVFGAMQRILRRP
jgi:hypothetical protein